MNTNEKMEKKEQKLEYSTEDTSLGNEKKAKEIYGKLEKKEIDFCDLTDDQRDVIIYNFNHKKENEDISELEYDKPDKKYIKDAEKAYNDALEAPTKLTFNLSVDGYSPLELATFLKEWNSGYAVVENKEWKGLLYFDEFLDERIKNLNSKTEKNFIINFNVLLYLDTIMTYPQGKGITFAKWMNKNQKLYDKIITAVEKHMNKVRLMNKKAALLREKWSLAMNGFKMKILLTRLEEYAKITSINTPK